MTYPSENTFARRAQRRSLHQTFETLQRQLVVLRALESSVTPEEENASMMRKVSAELPTDEQCQAWAYLVFGIVTP